MVTRAVDAAHSAARTRCWFGVGLGEHGVQHGDERDVEAIDDVEDVLAVRAAEDAVLVLDRRRCRSRRGRERPRRRACDSLDTHWCDDRQRLRLRLVDHAHDADLGAEALEVSRSAPR